MCYIDPATPRKFKCGHTIMEPEQDTPRMCARAAAGGQWCNPPTKGLVKGPAHPEISIVLHAVIRKSRTLRTVKVAAVLEVRPLHFKLNSLEYLLALSTVA